MEKPPEMTMNEAPERQRRTRIWESVEGGAKRQREVEPTDGTANASSLNEPAEGPTPIPVRERKRFYHGFYNVYSKHYFRLLAVYLFVYT